MSTLIRNKHIDLSIVPSFYCNMNCPYCYLNDLRNNQEVVSIESIRNRIKQLKRGEYQIVSISIYGGEVSLLDESYVDQLLQLTKQYCDIVGVTTNGQNRYIFDLCSKHNIRPMISYNQERPDHKRALQLIKQYDCTVGVVVLPSVLEQTAEQFCDLFDQLGRPVYLFQYYQSDPNGEYKITNKQFIDWVVDLLRYYYSTGNHNFVIVNEGEWLNDQYNCDDDAFVYIMPNGQYGTTQYVDCVEQYKYFDTIDQWEAYCKKRIITRKINCNSCKYFDKCKAEHVVVYNDEYCSGLKQVIDFYDNL